MTTRKLYGLQYLRGLAAAGVVCFHAADRLGYQFTVGEGGVDLFFILSGFLMWVIVDEHTRPLGFMLDRIKRIVPAYWIATGVIILGTLAGAFPRMVLSFSYVTKSLLFVPVFGLDGRLGPVLVPGWTLTYEMFFYAIFAVIMLQRGRAAQLGLLSAILIGLVILGFFIVRDTAIERTYTSQLLLEFLVGTWLGAAWKRYRQFPVRLGLPVILGAIALVIVTSQMNVSTHRAYLFGIPALMLIAGVLCVESRPGGVPNLELPRLVGDASYSIYLWHGIFVSCALRIVLPHGLPIYMSLPFCVAAGLVGGIIAYWGVERPLMRMFKRRRYEDGVPVPAGV